MPLEDPARTAEAIRRALPELVKLDRYERRARTKRDRTLRAFFSSRKELTDSSFFKTKF